MGEARMFSRILLVSLTSLTLTITCANAAGGGNHGNSGGASNQTSGGAGPNNGGAKTMSKTNLGGAEREFGKIVVNGVVNGGKMIDGSLGAVGRAGAATGHNGGCNFRC